eukprot:COSAG02_NODE_31565_length_531_cov_1.069444_1_plen_67_part_10
MRQKVLVLVSPHQAAAGANEALESGHVTGHMAMCPVTGRVSNVAYMYPKPNAGFGFGYDTLTEEQRK